MNGWKTCSIALTLALGVSVGFHFVPSAQADGKKDKAEKAVEKVELKMQPKMASALENLRKAKADLEEAAHNKGGHRVAALLLTRRAIWEVEEGVKFAAETEKEKKEHAAAKEKMDKVVADFEVCVKTGKHVECLVKFEEQRGKVLVVEVKK